MASQARKTFLLVQLLSCEVEKQILFNKKKQLQNGCISSPRTPERSSIDCLFHWQFESSWFLQPISTQE